MLRGGCSGVMVSGLGSWSSHSIVFMSQPLCSHTACLEVQLLNIYSFGELPWSKTA